MAIIPAGNSVTPTDDLKFGDLCKFWEWYGLFLGLVEPSGVRVINPNKITYDPKTHAPVGWIVEVWFSLQGEGLLEHQSKLAHVIQPPELKPDDFHFIAMLIDDSVRILPRATRDDYDCDDGLELINAVI